MKETILKLKTILSAKDFIVTGSFVLSEFGLVKKSDVQDIDIILVSPDVSTIETINRLMSEYPCKTEPKKPLNVPDIDPNKKASVKKATPDVSAIFLFDKVKVDVFIMDSCSYGTVIVDGLKYTTIDSIIKAKQGYGRMKDWLQLRDMARMFFKEEEFTDKVLNGNWRFALNQKY